MMDLFSPVPDFSLELPTAPYLIYEGQHVNYSFPSVEVKEEKKVNLNDPNNERRKKMIERMRQKISKK
jgi:hypothetical protein